MRTPWGESQSIKHIAEGIAFVTTASHGGYLLGSPQVAAVERKFPGHKTFCGEKHWYEEDCDWSFVALTFPQHFPPQAIEAAQKTRDYYANLNRSRPNLPSWTSN